MQQGGEPSIEEILASIKKVMAREEASPSGGGGIEPADEDEAREVLAFSEREPPAGGNPQAGAADGAAPARQGFPKLEGESSIRESLAALERLSRPGSSTQSGSSVDASLEALTRAMLRPMLTEWLDANLPEIVERMVQAEIVRIVERNR